MRLLLSIFLTTVICSAIHGQDYDNIEGAIDISLIDTDTWDSGPEAYTTQGAISQGPSSSCYNFPNRWFKFTAEKDFIQNTIYGGTMTHMEYGFFKALPEDNYQELACETRSTFASKYSSTYTI